MVDFVANAGALSFNVGMNDVTRILNDRQPDVADRLLPVIYDDLRRLANARMAAEPPGQTIAPTGLVHEAWLRLAGNECQWHSRGHFFAAAAEAMRRILIDRARSRDAQKRGGGYARADVEPNQLAEQSSSPRLIELDEALTRLADVEPDKAQLVKLRYFAGCSIQEAAKLLGVSTATADRHWAYARAWLQEDMRAQAES